MPHIFPHLPKYLSTNTSAPRTTACSSASSRLGKENNSILENYKQMFQEENISDLSSLKEKLLRETLASDFKYCIGNANYTSLCCKYFSR